MHHSLVIYENGMTFISEDTNARPHGIINWIVFLALNSDFIKGLYKSRINELLKMIRTQLGTITGFLTGHCNLNKHLYSMGIISNTLCRCSIQEKTTSHIFCDYVVLANFRHKILGILFPKPQEYHCILELLKEADLLKE